MQVIMLGLPGSGKTTQGKMLAEYLRIPHISVGDRLREIGRENTSFGRQLRDYWSQSECWQPLSDELMKKLFIREIYGYQIVIDGCPRNLNQLEWFSLDAAQKLFLWLDIPEPVARERAFCRGRSGDDIETRLKVESQRFGQTVDRIWHDAHFWAYKIDANKPIEEVHQQILGVFNAI